MERLLRLYRRGEISIGRLATALSRSVPEVLLALIEAENEMVVVSDKNALEAEQTTLALAGQSSIVLELSALVTLARFGLLSWIAQAFETILVAQHTYDDVLEARNRLEFGPPQQGSLALGPAGTIVAREADDTEARHILQQIAEFILRSCCVRAVPSIVEIRAADFARFSDALTSSAFASMLLACEVQRPVWVDDLIWRQICGLQGVASVWTAPVLGVLKARQRLDEDIYYSALECLARARYRPITIQADLFRWRLQKELFRPTLSVLASLQLLNATHMGFAEAMRLGYDLLCAIGVCQVPRTDRLLLFDAVLSALSKERSGSSVRQSLRASIAARWPLNAPYTKEMLQSLDMWETAYGNQLSLR